MKRTLWIILVLSLLLTPLNALADAGLRASWQEGGLLVAWQDACAGDASLTVYRDGWPVLAVSVRCAAGQYAVPAAYTSIPGSYSVRLNTANGCHRAVVPGSSPTTATPAPAQDPAATRTPVSTPTPTPQPTASGNASSDLAAQVVAQVNQERAKQGLNPLAVDSDLAAAARIRAEEIAQSFSHTRPDGRGWNTVSAKAYGENIAKGQRSADAVMAAWMSSAGHRENILRASYGSIGVCALRLDGVIYWVQLFGK